MDREWRVISWAHNYEEVRRVDNGKYLNPSKGRSGPVRVTIMGDNGLKYNGTSLARIVAGAFLTNDYNLPVVRHKDGNPENNRLDNLEWCTYSAKNKSGKHRDRSKNHPTESISVKCLETGKIYSSMGECAKDLGVCLSSVHQCAHGNYKSLRNGFHIVRVS